MLSKAERTKQFILETAAPIFNQKGISGASIDDVLDAAKVTKGCLYGHFESKEDLSLQVIDFLLENNSKRILTTISNGKTAKAKVFAFLDFYKDPFNTPVAGGCPLFNAAVEADDNFPEVKKRVAAALRRGHELFTRILQQGIDNGEFSNQLDSAAYVFKATAALEGALVLCRAMNMAKPMHGLIKGLKAELESYAT